MQGIHETGHSEVFRLAAEKVTEQEFEARAATVEIALDLILNDEPEEGDSLGRLG